MLSSEDLENLIASKKREIEREKTLLGLTPPLHNKAQEDKENEPKKLIKQVAFEHLKKPGLNQDNVRSEQKTVKKVLCEQIHNEKQEVTEESKEPPQYEHEEIPPDLERFIRRYIGLPIMLKAGEYSPNNPLVRGERAAGGDALLGLGEYERRRNTLRRYRQAQYRQYLDQQAKKKQEAKEEAERERREQEEKEKQREERERQLLLERDKRSPERRASVTSVPICTALVHTTKVDTGVQVDGISRPLSVAVQTDDIDLYQLSSSPVKCVTQAERELSPRTVDDNKDSWYNWGPTERRRSYGDFDERTSSVNTCGRQKASSELRHSYRPSIFDADAIQMRNAQAEKEAAARRQFYQQELKNQILEQQRIREERKSREKMLEQAEMRRLEEQLRMLRVAQEREKDKQRDISVAMKDSAKEFDNKRTELQRDINAEQHRLHHGASRTDRHRSQETTDQRSNLPFYYGNVSQPVDTEKKPYSFNIPDNSVFSSNYDVDSYLRRNLNFRDKMELEIDNIGNTDRQDTIDKQKNTDTIDKDRYQEKNILIEKALVHEQKEKQDKSDLKDYKNSLNKNFTLNNKNTRQISEDLPVIKHSQEYKSSPKQTNTKITRQISEDLSIPVLRHSPKMQQISNETTHLSEAMKKIDDKWKVPAVQKNILKTLPNEEGRNVSILTQLGSIRRQLQLEQLKLDRLLSKDGS